MELLPFVTPGPFKEPNLFITFTKEETKILTPVEKGIRCGDPRKQWPMQKFPGKCVCEVGIKSPTYQPNSYYTESGFFFPGRPPFSGRRLKGHFGTGYGQEQALPISLTVEPTQLAIYV